MHHINLNGQHKKIENYLKYKTKGGVSIEYKAYPINDADQFTKIIDNINKYKGISIGSNFEFAGRYNLWNVAFYNPPLEIVATNRKVQVNALNKRGEVLIPFVLDVCNKTKAIQTIHNHNPKSIYFTIKKMKDSFSEEERSQQSSVFSFFRNLISALGGNLKDRFLGLYGAFGYNLVFQFEKFNRHANCNDNEADVHLYIPDALYLTNLDDKKHCLIEYEYEYAGLSTKGLARIGNKNIYNADIDFKSTADMPPGAYQDIVKEAKKYFKRGDLFEVVPSIKFSEKCIQEPASVFYKLRKLNPSPYSFFMNLGRGEFLVGSSPEIFIQTQNKTVETAPISGTVKRGNNPLEDAEQVKHLINSVKDETELNMCTDVDRNDKSRICLPGSVTIIGRRQIEMYSHLIHTVDHVKGILRPEFDGLDAFLSHAWAVTVSGAPKRDAMRFIEKYEVSPRRWYAGAVGSLLTDGSVNTGITLRTVHFYNGHALIRAGATLLVDSDPQSEEAEILLKLQAMRAVLNNNIVEGTSEHQKKLTAHDKYSGMRVLLVDCNDSFVHTLGNYFRMTGAEVSTWRYDFNIELINSFKPDLVVISPGPGKPDNFNLKILIKACLQRNICIFGVCLGMQAIAEYWNGKLGQLESPVHGKASKISLKNKCLFNGLPKQIEVGRYHSLFVKIETLSSDLEITALSQDGIIMALCHKKLPIWGVQFHPESLLTLKGAAGNQIVENVMSMVRKFRTANINLQK